MLGSSPPPPDPAAKKQEVRNLTDVSPSPSPSPSPPVSSELGSGPPDGKPPTGPPDGKPGGGPPNGTPGKGGPPGNSRKLGVRHILLIVEMSVLTLSVIFIEVMLVPALPMIITRSPWLVSLCYSQCLQISESSRLDSMGFISLHGNWRSQAYFVFLFLMFFQL